MVIILLRRTVLENIAVILIAAGLMRKNKQGRFGYDEILGLTNNEIFSRLVV